MLPWQSKELSVKASYSGKHAINIIPTYTWVNINRLGETERARTSILVHNRLCAYVDEHR